MRTIFLSCLLVVGLASGCSGASNQPNPQSPSSKTNHPTEAIVEKNPDALSTGAVAKLVTAQQVARTQAGSSDVQTCVDNAGANNELVSCLTQAVDGIGKFYRAMSAAYQEAQSESKGQCLESLKSFNKGMSAAERAYRVFAQKLKNQLANAGVDQTLGEMGSLPALAGLSQVETNCGIRAGTLWIPDVS